MQKRLLLTAVFALALQAHAEGGSNLGSEYQWQTGEGKVEVTGTLDYYSATTKYKSTSTITETNTKGLSETVMGEYGLTDMFSAGGWIRNRDWKNEFSPSSNTSTKYSGFGDLVLFFHGKMDMGTGSFRYGADINLGLGKQKQKSNGDLTYTTGGMGLTPFVGYEMYSNSCTYGARLSHELALAHRKREVEGTTTVEHELSGAEPTELAFFYEHNMQPMILGAALEFTSVSKEEDKNKSTNTTSKSAGHTSTALALYVPYEVAENITILPEFKYGKYTAYDSSSIDSVTFWDLSVGGRFAF
ncbi:MAG: hypothetical protein AB7F86_09005 [Bdellovibrionales bacterium]